MQVTFVSGEKGKARTLRMDRYDGGTYLFQSGVYTTTDKDEIKELLHSEEYERNLFELRTPMELVEQYLEGDEPDRITDKELSELSEEGYFELAEYFGISDHGGHPTVIKEVVKDQPVDDSVAFILDKYKAESEEDKPEDLLAKGKEVGVIYRSGPWHKLKTAGDGKDEAMAKSEKETQKWIENHRAKVKQRIEDANAQTKSQDEKEEAPSEG